MILCEKIQFEDLIFIDSTLYKSLNNLKETIQYNYLDDDNNFNILPNLDLNDEMKDINNHIHSFELVKIGRNTNESN
jgi:hypothetical protein